MLRFTVSVAAALMLGSVLVAEQAPKNSSSAAAAEEFVRKFYDWYVPKASTGAGRVWDIAWKQNGPMFDRSLIKALAADAEAQSRARGTGELVGLDFDPFLGGQDPCDHYETRLPVRKADRYQISIVPVCHGEKLPSTSVAEVAQRGNRWVFINFHYPPPANTDLLTVL